MLFWKCIYNTIAVPTLWIIIQIAGIFNAKISKGVVGRKHILHDIQSAIPTFSTSHRIWFHSSSLGEFEQAKPIINQIKKVYPKINIIVTFFSPSGYEHSQNYKLANCITYIPFDSHRQMKRFIQTLQPTIAIILRYDIWPNMIWSLHKDKIPIFLVNATMRKNSSRKLPFLLQFHRSLYNHFYSIATVSETDSESFKNFGNIKTTIQTIGDTRFDQVLQRSNETYSKHLLHENITKGKTVLIIGQSWKEDEDVFLLPLFQLHKEFPELLTIIVPHEPTVTNLEQLEYRLEEKTSFIRFSDMNDYNDEKIIIVDSVGILFSLYRYGTMAYVGGGFKQGVHNVLEPAIFGIPVMYGPQHINSQEATLLLKEGGGFVVENSKSLYKTIKQLLTEPSAAGTIAKKFVEKRSGATQRFMKCIEPFLKH